MKDLNKETCYVLDGRVQYYKAIYFSLHEDILYMAKSQLGVFMELDKVDCQCSRKVKSKE